MLTPQRERVIKRLQKAGGRIEAKDFPRTPGGLSLVPLSALGVTGGTLLRMERDGLIHRHIVGKRTMAVWLPETNGEETPTPRPRRYRMSRRDEIRQAIRRGKTTLDEIAQELGVENKTIHSTIHLMKKQGELATVERGVYALPREGEGGVIRRSQVGLHNRNTARRDRVDGRKLLDTIDDNRKVAEAIDLLFPNGIKNTPDLVAWIDMTRRMMTNG